MGGLGGMFVRRCAGVVIVDKVELCRKWIVGKFKEIRGSSCKWSELTLLVFDFSPPHG